MKGEAYSQADVAASFQKAVIDVLVEHSLHAVRAFGYDKFAIAGGVASNSSLRASTIAVHFFLVISFSRFLSRRFSDRHPENHITGFLSHPGDGRERHSLCPP